MLGNIATNKLDWQKSAFGTSMAQQKSLAETGWAAKKSIAAGHDIARETAAKARIRLNP